MAREGGDERHICPLQLDVIDRCIELWSNPGELVYSPFAGIASEGYGAIKAGRKFRGTELKGSYFETGCRYLEELESTANDDLFGDFTAAATATPDRTGGA